MTLLTAAAVLLSTSRGSSKEATEHYRRRVTATFDAQPRYGAARQPKACSNFRFRSGRDERLGAGAGAMFPLSRFECRRCSFLQAVPRRHRQKGPYEFVHDDTNLRRHVARAGPSGKLPNCRAAA
jgi:hypothetical protein